MKKLTFGLCLCCKCICLFSQSYAMSASAIYTTCSGKFYDDGGPDKNYLPNQSELVTFKPSNSSDKLSVTFNYYRSYDDTLFVFNGSSTSSPLIGKLIGSAGYGTISSSAPDGSLTFKFVSNGVQAGNADSGWSASIACNFTPPDFTMLGSGTFTTCGGNFYDGGGPFRNYMVNQNVVTTLKPPNSSDKLSVTFNYYRSYDDTLFVFNGSSTSAPLIGKLIGSAGYGTISSSAPDGSLTFKFVSNGVQAGNADSGWSASIACNFTPPDFTMLGSGTFTTCGGNFYDGGGPFRNYMVNQNVVTTLKPPNSSDKLSVTFNYYRSYDDTLFVFNGSSTSSPLIGKLIGSAGYGTISSSAPDGSLTFKFVSNGVQAGNADSGWSASIACNFTPPDFTMLGSGTFTTCGGNFYDGGGPFRNYMVNQNVVTTLKPPNSSDKLSVTFNYYRSYDDTLFVFNGSSTSSPLIGKLIGSAGYGTISSSAPDGSLTFKFVSNGVQAGNADSGWSASIACNFTPPDFTMLGSGTFTTCGGNFYDGGGPFRNYMVNQNVVTTLKPPNSSDKLSVTFDYYRSYDDTLFVFNGSSTSSPLIGKLIGSAGYGTISSSAPDGSLTFKFVSNGVQAGNADSGWSASIACKSIRTNNIVISSSQIPLWQRAGDLFSGSMTVDLPATVSNSKWHIEADAFNQTGQYVGNINIGIGTGSNTILFTSNDVSTYIHPGWHFNWSAVLEANNSVVTAPQQTKIIESKWVTKNVVYYNEGTNQLLIPLQYFPNTSSTTITFSRVEETSYEKDNFAAIPPPGSSKVTVPIVQLGNQEFFVLSGANSLIRSVNPGVFNYTITYNPSAFAKESGSFDLTKIGRIINGNSISDHLVIFIGGIKNTIENDIMNLKSSSSESSSQQSFSLASYIGSRSRYDTWYIAQGNGNYVKSNAFDLGIAIDTIFQMKPGLKEIDLIAHSKAGLETRALLGSNSQTASSLTESLSKLSYNYQNAAWKQIVSKVVFLDVPHWGAWDSFISSWLPFVLPNSPAIIDLTPNSSILTSLNGGLVSIDPAIQVLNLSGFYANNQLNDGAVQLQESENPQIHRNYIQLYQNDPRSLTSYPLFNYHQGPLSLHANIHCNYILSRKGECIQTITNLDKILFFIEGTEVIPSCTRNGTTFYGSQ